MASLKKQQLSRTMALIFKIFVRSPKTNPPTSPKDSSEPNMFAWLLTQEVPPEVALSLGLVALVLLATIIFIVALEDSPRKKTSDATRSSIWTDAEAIMLEDTFHQPDVTEPAAPESHQQSQPSLVVPTLMLNGKVMTEAEQEFFEPFGTEYDFQQAMKRYTRTKNVKRAGFLAVPGQRYIDDVEDDGDVDDDDDDDFDFYLDDDDSEMDFCSGQ